MGAWRGRTRGPEDPETPYRWADLLPSVSRNVSRVVFRRRSLPTSYPINTRNRSFRWASLCIAYRAKFTDIHELLQPPSYSRPHIKRRVRAISLTASMNNSDSSHSRCRVSRIGRGNFPRQKRPRPNHQSWPAASLRAVVQRHSRHKMAQ